MQKMFVIWVLPLYMCVISLLFLISIFSPDGGNLGGRTFIEG